MRREQQESVSKACDEPATVRHSKCIIFFYGRDFPSLKMWYPSLMSTLSHPHPYSSIWLLSATLCMLRAPNYFHAAAGNAHTSDVVLFDLSAAVNNRPLIYSWKVMFPWHHSHLILLIPPGHLFQSLSLDLLLFPELKLLQLCPGLCLHNCFMSSHVILQLSISYMLILCFSLAFFLLVPSWVESVLYFWSFLYANKYNYNQTCHWICLWPYPTDFYL